MPPTSSCYVRAFLLFSRWRCLSQFSGTYTGPVVYLPRSERYFLSYRDKPSRQSFLLSQQHLMAVESTAIRVVNYVMREFFFISQIQHKRMPTTTGPIYMYWDDSLTNPGVHQEALELTSWLKPLCQRLGWVTNLEFSIISSQVTTYLGI